MNSLHRLWLVVLIFMAVMMVLGVLEEESVISLMALAGFILTGIVFVMEGD